MLTPQSPAGVLRFAVTTNSGGGEIATTWTNAPPVGQRTHVALAYDFIAGTTLLYINGQRVANGVATIPLRAINDINVWLGRSNWPDPYFNGQLDEFRLYDGVLSDGAVAASYGAGPNFLPGSRPGLSFSFLGAALQLAWPAGASDFTLQSADPFGSDAIWRPVLNPLVQQQDQLTVTLPVTNSTQFFRLQK
jgi:hypothetical protein